METIISKAEEELASHGIDVREKFFENQERLELSTLRPARETPGESSVGQSALEKGKEKDPVEVLKISIAKVVLEQPERLMAGLDLYRRLSELPEMQSARVYAPG